MEEKTNGAGNTSNVQSKVDHVHFSFSFQAPGRDTNNVLFWREQANSSTSTHEERKP